MTKIEYYIKNGYYCLRAEGHAGYNKEGEDIVCAAISALLQMCWAGLERECGAAGEQRQESGEFYFGATVGEENRKEADVLMNSVIYGLELIQKGFPECVEVKETSGGVQAFFGQI